MNWLIAWTSLETFRIFTDMMEWAYLSMVHHLGLDARKPVFGGVANNTGADQPAHPRSLISAFVIRYLESIICKLATGDISIF